ncbi:MAG: hypothetical protein N2Z69_01990 [Methylophilaceae bacterium]|nr:hypothetical protein [Methylophilaceae bacterium]
MGRLTCHRAQRGFVLFMTLMTLVLLTLSGLAMMRSTEAGVSASGNIAFRQAAVRVADVAIEHAVQWLKAHSGQSILNNAAMDDDGHTFYYPALGDFNPANHNWEGGSHLLPDRISGYDVHYVIHRVAQNAGDCASSTDNAYCQYVPGASKTGNSVMDGLSREFGGGEGEIYDIQGSVYYRITVKVSGPRHNISHVQAFVY